VKTDMMAAATSIQDENFMDISRLIRPLHELRRGVEIPLLPVIFENI